MKSVIIGAAAALLLASAGTAQTDQFTVQLPAGFSSFEKQAQTAKTEEGTIETTNWISKAPTGEAVVVTVSKMPGKILDPDKMMGGARDALLKSLKATIEREEAIDGAIPGRRLIFKNGSAWLRSRLLVDDDRFYQVLYVGRSPEQRDVPAVAQLFDSFQIKQ